MKNSNHPSFQVPLPFRLSGSSLKVIALLSMVADHIALYFVEHGTALYEIMRCFGRIAFPVFAFLIAEGFAHSRNRMRYFLTLLSFAIVSEIPWYLIGGADGTHNVMFTLTMGVAALAFFEGLQYHKVLNGCVVLWIAWLATAFGVDYEWRGILMIVIFYMFRRRDAGSLGRILQIIFTFPLMMHYGIMGALLASIVVFLYDGRRGFIKRNVCKYGFYAFYPMHLMVIWVLLATMK